jgi:hypothetical protein
MGRTANTGGSSEPKQAAGSRSLKSSLEALLALKGGGPTPSSDHKSVTGLQRPRAVVSDAERPASPN